MQNPWLNAYQRSFQQIKAKLLNGLSGIKDSQGNPLITDISEGNIFVIIISMFAAIAEVLHYYIDNMARETFFVTARRYESVVRHGKLVDYYARGAIASTVDVTLTRPLNSSSISGSVNIPKGTVFIDSSGNRWVSTKAVIWNTNTTTCTVPLIQHSSYTYSSAIGLTLPQQDGKLTLALPDISVGYYEHGTMSLALDGVDWALVDTFAYSKPTDFHYMVSVSSDQKVQLIFGDGKFGHKANPHSRITKCTCYVTRGAAGNVPSGSLTALPTVVSNAVSDATCSNVYDAGGGSDYEDFDMLKEHIPLSVKTLGVAITKQDFVDLAKQVAGVNQAAVEYECGRKLNVYISADNGGIASSTLCERVYNYLHQHSPLTTWLSVKTVGQVNIILNMTVTGKKSYSSEDIHAQVLNALLDTYSLEKAQIGGKVRISDIYALIDNLSMVDYLTIQQFYIRPWPNTIAGSRELKLTSFILTEAKSSMQYFITFTSSSAFTVRSEYGGYVTTGSINNVLSVDDTINGFKFSFTVGSNNYSSGYKYSFTISEPNHDYEDPGFNLPVFLSSSQLTIKINEVL